MFRSCDAARPVDDAACTLAKHDLPHHPVERLNVPALGAAFDVATDPVETACSAFIPG